MARVVITGAAGFIGSHLAEAFLERVEQYANLSEMKRSIRRLHAISRRDEGGR